MLAIHLMQALLHNMRIDLCGGNIRMTEHVLQGAQVYTPFEQMGRKRMA
jgi:hypothetical protein